LETAVARILTVEDEPNLRFSIRQTLKRAGHEVAEAESVTEAWQQIQASDFDAILTDVNLGEENGIDLVKRLRGDGFEGAIVVMTAFATIQNAVTAMKLGADDYLQKPLSLEELTILIERLLENRRVRKRLNLYQRMESTRTASRGPVGDSPVWKETLRLAERLSTAPVSRNGSGNGNPTILILGETGTGKGLLANYIHQHALKHEGKKAEDAPFVHVNCSALPPTLVESELFGHEKGAFTDAKAARAGLFEMAEGGTIFLDEIGDMPLDLQAKILTVVEEGIYRRVGGGRDKTVRCRIITATNQPLEERVEQGKFRRDLLYRLNALTIRIPPLRDRADDCVAIAQAMLERFAKDFGRGMMRLGEDAKQSLRRHVWPGNVRELINVVQRVAMLNERPEVTAADLALPAAPRVRATALPAAGSPVPAPPAPVPGSPAPAVAPAAGNGSFAVSHSDRNGHAHAAGNGPLTFDFDAGVHKAEDVEKELIVQSLRRTHGNVSKAAKLIGMQRSSFRYRIERYGLQELVQEIASR
jgi:two-component system response regulator AtoC